MCENFPGVIHVGAGNRLFVFLKIFIVNKGEILLNQFHEYRTAIHDLSTYFSTGVENEVAEN
jgi:hypothetical protein